MTLEKEYYQDNETVTGYHEAMSAVLAKIHPDASARAKADEIARGVRRGRSIRISDAAHLPPAEQPAAVATALDDFFRRIDEEAA